MLVTLLIIWLALQPVGLFFAVMLCRAASAGDRMRNLGDVDSEIERRPPVARPIASTSGSKQGRPRFGLVPRATAVRRPTA